MQPSQLALPVDVRPEQVALEKTLGDALGLCAKVAGFSLDKQLSDALGFDKAQFSRWLSGGEGIIWPKFVAIMDHCGNDTPLLWMLHQRGYDLNSLRKRESETERKLRLAQEEIAQLKAEREIERRFVRDTRSL